MKILYLVSSPTLNPFLNTGYARHIRETIEGLNQRGHEVKLVTRGKFESSIDTQYVKDQRGHFFIQIKRLFPVFVWESIKDFRLLLSNSEYQRRVIKSIEEYDPDVVYERIGYLSRTHTITTESRWLIEINAPIVEERAKLSGRSALLWLAEMVERNRYNKVDHIFCVSGILKEYIVRKYDLPDQKITVNHNGVNPVEFEHPVAKWTNQPFTYGFVGSILAYHGVDKLISAFAQVNRIYPDSRLLIIGDGGALNDLKQQTIEQGIDSRVEFTGSVAYNQVSSFLSEIDVCLLPSTEWYCSPIKIFEYGIMKKPIIAPRVVPVMELMEDKRDGLLVSNVAELVDAMIFMKENNSDAQQMAKEFHNKVLNYYTWSHNIDRIVEEFS